MQENQGNFYVHTPGQPDYSLDARIYDQWTHSLVIRLMENLALAPKLQYLFYENQVDRQRIHSFSTNVTLQYSFGWHSGMRWRDAMRYADPTLKSGK